MKKQKKTKLESPFGYDTVRKMKTIEIDKIDPWFDFFIELEDLARRASKTKGKTDYYAKRLGDIYHKYHG